MVPRQIASELHVGGALDAVIVACRHNTRGRADHPRAGYGQYQTKSSLKRTRRIGMKGEKRDFCAIVCMGSSGGVERWLSPEAIWR